MDGLAFETGNFDSFGIPDGLGIAAECCESMVPESLV